MIEQERRGLMAAAAGRAARRRFLVRVAAIADRRAERRFREYLDGFFDPCINDDQRARLWDRYIEAEDLWTKLSSMRDEG